MHINVLLVGDVVGKPGRTILKDLLPAFMEEHRIEFVIVNGENAAQGSGLTENLFKELVRAGADVVTLGENRLRTETAAIVAVTLALAAIQGAPRRRSVGEGGAG